MSRSGTILRGPHSKKRERKRKERSRRDPALKTKNNNSPKLDGVGIKKFEKRSHRSGLHQCDRLEAHHATNSETGHPEEWNRWWGDGGGWGDITSRSQHFGGADSGWGLWWWRRETEGGKEGRNKRRKKGVGGSTLLASDVTRKKRDWRSCPRQKLWVALRIFVNYLLKLAGERKPQNIRTLGGVKRKKTANGKR